jgi:hypothetical protein
MEQTPQWTVRFDFKTRTWVIELWKGADKIGIPGSHPTYESAMEQAQLLYRASLIPIFDGWDTHTGDTPHGNQN